jgi:phosphoglycerol transferase MdoB-like AlkP superfamily enzyme
LLSIRNSPFWQRHKQTQIQGWQMIFQESRIQKQAGVTMIISDKVYIKPKLGRIKNVTTC